MPDARFYYDVLELDAGASQDEIKVAYRDMAQVWHPDRFANSPRLQQKAVEKMKEINEAYEFLKNYNAPQAKPAHPTSQRSSNHASAPWPASRPQPQQESQRTSSQRLADEMWCMRGHTDLISSTAYSPSGKLLISGSYDKTVRIWQTGTGLEKLWFLGHKSAVTSVVFAPDNRGALSGGMDKSVFLRDCESRKEIQYFYAAAVVECVAISPDNRYVVTGTVGAGTQLWEVSSGRELRRFGVGGFVSSVAFSPLGNRVAIGTSDGEVNVFDRVDGSVVSSWRVLRDGAGQMVQTVRFSRDGVYLMTASTRQIQTWQVKSGMEAARLETGISGVTSADLAPDGSCVCTGHSDWTVRLWSLARGTEIHVYKGHTEAVKTVAYAPDGLSLASGGFDKTLRMWRVQDK